MGGVRILEGTYDGSGDAACMVNDSSGVAFGPIFTGYDAGDQAEAFLSWLRDERWHDDRVRACVRAFRGENEYARYLLSQLVHRDDDPRAWTDNGLVTLVGYWRSIYVNEEDDCLHDPTECGRCHHGHLVDDGVAAECPSCGCDGWTPGNPAAELLTTTDGRSNT
jgi:hypothetical protein